MRSTLSMSGRSRTGTTAIVAVGTWMLHAAIGLSGESDSSKATYSTTVKTLQVSVKKCGEETIQVPESVERVKVEGVDGYCEFSKPKVLGGKPTQIASDFFAVVRRALEIGVEPKVGLVGRHAYYTAAGRGYDSAVPIAYKQAKRVLDLGTQTCVRFWGAQCGIHFLKTPSTFEVTIRPRPGETKTLVIADCYTEGDLASLKNDMVKAAQILIRRVDEAVGKAKEDYELQQRKFK